MINYEKRFGAFNLLLRFYGSQWPRATLLALPSAILAGLLSAFIFVDKTQHLFLHPYPYAVFSGVVAFILIFRTNLSYALEMGRRRNPGEPSLLQFAVAFYHSILSLPYFNHFAVQLRSLCSHACSHLAHTFLAQVRIALDSPNPANLPPDSFRLSVWFPLFPPRLPQVISFDEGAKEPVPGGIRFRSEFVHTMSLMHALALQVCSMACELATCESMHTPALLPALNTCSLQAFLFSLSLSLSCLCDLFSFPSHLPLLSIALSDIRAEQRLRGDSYLSNLTYGRFMDIPPEPPVDADQVEEWNRVRGNKSLVFLRAHRPHLEKYWRALPLAVLGGVNPTECSILEPSRDRVYLVMCWLHRALVARRMAGGISQDAPIVSRIYQVLSDGMLGYENALKIVNTPFPFPFAQCVALLLHINALIIPLLMADWLADPYLASAITFLSVFSFYLLNEVAREIEEPFRFDPNDLPVVYLHHKFNERLVTAFSRSVFPADGLFTHIDEKEMAWLLAKHRPVTVVKVVDEKVGAKDCVIDVLCGDKLGEKARAEAGLLSAFIFVDRNQHLFLHPYPYAVFSGVVAFILIFRTNLSYAFQMGRCRDPDHMFTMPCLHLPFPLSSPSLQVISFDEGAEESVPGGIRFRSEFVHTMSLMHALAMQRLRGDSYLSNLTYGRFMHIPPEPPVDADQVEEWNHSCGPSICFPLCPSPSLPLYCCCTGRFMDIPPEPPVDADQVEEWNRVRGNKSLVFLRAHRPHLEKYWRALPLAVLGGVNPTECSILEPSRDRVYLVMCWLHHALVARRMAGGISQDAPIVSRIYQVLSDGMLGYENALKIVNTPFPFPFAQCVALLLHINALVIPLLMADWLADPFLASAITLLSVFSFYLLNEVAREIEEPFRFDPNDLPVVYLHHKFNERLVTAFSRSVFPADGLFTHIDEKEMEWLLAKHRPLTVKKGLEEKLGVSAKDCVVDVLCGAKPGEKRYWEGRTMLAQMRSVGCLILSMSRPFHVSTFPCPVLPMPRPSHAPSFPCPVLPMPRPSHAPSFPCPVLPMPRPSHAPSFPCLALSSLLFSSLLFSSLLFSSLLSSPRPHAVRNGETLQFSRLKTGWNMDPVPSRLPLLSFRLHLWPFRFPHPSRPPQVISFDEGGQEEPVEPGGIRFRSEFVHTMSLMHALALQVCLFGRFMDIPPEPPVDSDQVEEWINSRLIIRFPSASLCFSAPPALSPTRVDSCTSHQSRQWTRIRSSIFLRAHRPHLEKYWRALPLAVLGGVNPTECSILEPSRDRVYLVMCWLHRALVARRMAGGISQDAPIVSRIYQVHLAVALFRSINEPSMGRSITSCSSLSSPHRPLSSHSSFPLLHPLPPPPPPHPPPTCSPPDGMLGYENALKIVNTPFPFPFAQCVALLLHINALIIPLLMADWLADPYLASAITLLSVFSFYLLNEVAREIEEPFQFDPDDLPMVYLHHKFNERLVTAFSISVYPADGLFTQIDEREMEWLLAKHQLVMVTTGVEGEEGVAVLCADEPRDKVRAEAGSGGG
ncbi:unnamed protein product [Closterium sp. NIES-65]|nr:unnamed protein product [Closterium sp. NIES-65]